MAAAINAGKTEPYVGGATEAHAGLHAACKTEPHVGGAQAVFEPLT